MEGMLLQADGGAGVEEEVPQVECGEPPRAGKAGFGSN